jgi:hypothetical protein
VVEVYVLAGCEACQVALERLRPMLDDGAPDVHLLLVGVDSGIDAYHRFGLPIWRTTRNLADIFGLKAYPVFLGVDQQGMIRSAGSTHDPDALRSYLAIGSDEEPTPRPPQRITITTKP